MSFWVAAVLLLICVIGTVLLLRAYLRRGDTAFLCAGIALLVICFALLFYTTAVLWLVWSID